jgi:hypothetical protein
MKKFSIPTFAAMLCVLNVFAQQANDVGAFAKLTVEEAERLINTTEGTKARMDLVSVAIAARRLDLIKLGFENPHTRLGTVMEAASIADPAFRDEVVLMMLRSPSRYWPIEEPSFMTRITGVYMVEPFISTFKSWLPDVPLKSEVLETRASRLQLASRLEAAISEAKSKEEPNSISQNESEPSSQATKEIQKDAIPTTVEKQAQAIPQGVLVNSAIAAICLFGLFLKARK